MSTIRDASRKSRCAAQSVEAGSRGEAAFWRGEIVPAPNDETRLEGQSRSFWEGGFSGRSRDKTRRRLPVRRRLRSKKASGGKHNAETHDRRLRRIPRRHGAELAPDAAKRDQEKLALELMRAELKALADLLSKDDVQEFRESIGRAPGEAVTVPMPAPIPGECVGDHGPDVATSVSAVGRRGIMEEAHQGCRRAWCHWAEVGGSLKRSATARPSSRRAPNANQEQRHVPWRDCHGPALPVVGGGTHAVTQDDLR